MPLTSPIPPPRAVIFDLGGVVFESPLHEIATFEAENGLVEQSIATAIGRAGPDGAWSRLERGELARLAFPAVFAVELSGYGIDIDTADLMSRIEGSFRVRPEMIRAITRLRSQGTAVAALTNNWSPMAETEIATHFDVFVESVTSGARKPEPAIYLLTCDKLGIAATEIAMLDDIGSNLKTARDLGMATHKVSDPAVAIKWLGDIFGWGEL